LKSVFGTTVLPNTKLFFFLPQFQPQFFNQTQETVFFKTTTSTIVLTKHQFFLKQPHKKYFLLNYFFQTATTKATTIPNTLEEGRSAKDLLGLIIHPSSIVSHNFHHNYITKS
jgi:hypothetical protein